jgi:dipeptidase
VVPQGIEGTRSAVAVFKRLLSLVAEHHDTFLPEMTAVWEGLEQKLAAELPDLESTATILLDAGRADLAETLLTRWCHAEAVAALDLGEAIVRSVEARSRILFGLREEPGWRGPDQLW